MVLERVLAVWNFCRHPLHTALFLYLGVLGDCHGDGSEAQSATASLQNCTYLEFVVCEIREFVLIIRITALTVARSKGGHVTDRPIELGAKVEPSVTHAVQIMSDQQRARTMRGGMSGG